MFLGRPACALLDDVADYLLNDGPLLAGETMLLGRDVIPFVESGQSECAKALARRGSLPRS